MGDRMSALSRWKQFIFRLHESRDLLMRMVCAAGW
jgi:hypothetical protein